MVLLLSVITAVISIVLAQSMFNMLVRSIITVNNCKLLKMSRKGLICQISMDKHVT